MSFPQSILLPVGRFLSFSLPSPPLALRLFLPLLLLLYFFTLAAEEEKLTTEQSESEHVKKRWRRKGKYSAKFAETWPSFCFPTDRFFFFFFLSFLIKSNIMPDYLIIYVAQQLVLIDEPIKNSQIFGTLDPFGRQTRTRGRKIDA